MAEEKKFSNIPKEINSVFGDEANEVEEPKAITPEDLNEKEKEADTFSD